MSQAIHGLEADEPPAELTAPPSTLAGAERERRQAVLAVAAAIGTAIVAAVVVGSMLLRPAPAPSTPPVATPVPSSGAVRGEVAVNSLVAAVSAADRTWRVEATIQLWRDNARGTVQFRATVNGDDSAGTVSGSLITGDHDWVVVGDRRWRRIDGGTWKAVPKLDPNRGWDPFAALDGSTVLRFVRWEQKDTVRYAQVSVGGLLVLDPTAYFEGPYEITDVRDATMFLDVDADGRPARGTAQATVLATDASGEAHEFRLKAAYTFTDVGRALTVEPPRNQP